MQFKKIFILTVFTSATLAVLGQGKVDTIRVLDLTGEKSYKENNTFWSDSSVTVRQEVAFNDPNVIDEEYIQLLTITFPLNPTYNTQKNFDLVADSLIIKCNYQRLSVWHWGDRENKISGHLKIVSKTKRRIRLEFDLIVTEPNRGFYVYKGIREFRKSKPLDTYHYRLTAANRGIATSVAGRWQLQAAVHHLALVPARR